MPKVAIGIPVRNGERFLKDALDSIRQQTFGDFEVIVSDNASNDTTPEIASEVCNSDARFKYCRHEVNLGAAGNFNYVFHNTSAPYFRWAAHDDMMRPDYLAACVAALDAGSSEAVLAYPQTILVDTDGRELRHYNSVTRKGGNTPSERLAHLIGPGDRTQSLLHMCFPVFGLIKRSALEGTSLIANLPRSDTLLLVELALKGHFIEIDEPLFLRREHDQGSVISAEKTARGPELERLLASWFDPRRGKKFPATVTRLGVAYLKAVMRTPMPAREKARCLSLVLNWIRRNGRIIAGEIKIVSKEFVGSRRVAS